MPEGSRDILSQRNEENLKAYEALSKLPFPKSYAGKMLLVAFLGPPCAAGGLILLLRTCFLCLP